jgi:hypothetical protein
MNRTLVLCALGLSSSVTIRPLFGQSLGNAGTIEGTVIDATGAAMAKAVASLHNPLTNYTQSATSGSDGSFRLVNIPPNPYHLQVMAPGFAPLTQDVDIRNSLPIQVKTTLQVASSRESVTVEASVDILENEPSAHVDAERSVINQLPQFDPAGRLSQANQQASMRLACNGVYATVANPISDCTNPNGSMGKVTSKLLTLVPGGYGMFPSQENDDHNPDRVFPRHLLDFGVGADNLLHTEKHQRITASLAITNLTNKVALYNFLSTFSGTHFLQPRTVVGRFGFAF